MRLDCFALFAAYALLALSFAARAVQGLFAGDGFAAYLPYDAMLSPHLMVALPHAPASGAFALSIAYERTAATLRRADVALYRAMQNDRNRVERVAGRGRIAYVLAGQNRS